MESSEASACGTVKFAPWVRSKRPSRPMTSVSTRCACRQQCFSQTVRFNERCVDDGACTDLGFSNSNGDDFHRHDDDNSTHALDPSLWSFLPSELTERVLACSPMASLFRFRAVCRSWNTAPFQPTFKSLRAGMKIPEAWLIMLAVRRRAGKTFTVSSLRLLAYNLESNKPVALPDTFLPFQLDSGCFSYCTAAGGLICYHLHTGFDHANLYKENHVSLWVGNPFTKEWKCLPPTIGSFPLNFPLRGLVGMVAFDSAMDCNMQAMAVERRTHYKIIVRTVSQVRWGSEMMTEEYDSLTNAWTVTTMRDVPLDHRIEQVVHCNGSLYFLTWQARNGIYAYDMAKQEWMHIPAPKRTYQFTSPHMVECGGCLMLVSGVGRHHMTRIRGTRQLRTRTRTRTIGIELWMLVEDNTTNSIKTAIADTERATTAMVGSALRAWRLVSQMPKELVHEFVTGVQFHCTSIRSLIYLTNGTNMVTFDVKAHMWRRVIIPQLPFLVQDFVSFAPKLEALP